MLLVKERIMGAVTVMTEEEANKIWQIIQYNHLEEVEPLPDEIAALEAYRNGDPEYQPTISHEEVLKELFG
ncbi:MAG: hypothetical protein FWF59_01655 [Turicibacter sp.]|nr:hypothetical protein [Turicibacter sp.]